MSPDALRWSQPTRAAYQVKNNLSGWEFLTVVSSLINQNATLGKSNTLSAPLPCP